MRSVRFDPELDEQVRRAAERQGVSVSEFIRRAVADRAGQVLGEPTMLELWGDYIGSVADTDDAEPVDDGRRHGEIFGQILEEKHVRQQKRRHAG